jgi:cell wall-associated NlpC family hydrolase
MITVTHNTVTVSSPRGPETHVFASEQEATARAAIVHEALSWVGTPFRDCADIKGPDGAVDCAMLLVRVFVDTGRLAPFDPRPYPARWHLHRSRERFLEWIEDRLGARQVECPQIGDVVIWQFGRCFSHGAILINSEEVVHAYAHARQCLVSRLDEHPLRYVSLNSTEWPRPVRYYDVWGKPEESSPQRQ